MLYRDYMKIIEICKKARNKYIREIGIDMHKNCSEKCRNPWCEIGQLNNICKELEDKIEKINIEAKKSLGIEE